MKKEGLLWVMLCLGCSLALWAAIYFREVQENYFNKINSEYAFLQKKVRTLKKDLEFVNSYQDEIDYLFEKSWFVPKNRLLVGEFLESLRHLVTRVSYRFDPEIVKSPIENTSYKVTQIVFEAESRFDGDLYTFMDKLRDEFPGVLIPRDLIFRRQSEPPHHIEGKFIFDWFGMGGEGHEN